MAVRYIKLWKLLIDKNEYERNLFVQTGRHFIHHHDQIESWETSCLSPSCTEYVKPKKWNKAILLNK